ncbi:UDP-glycosyltransferase UGT5-like [Phlebotomus argentipes]|uniref:UDP-glycosyltransferase UGT5-like n=1 Tax=Phlebotomus argentipes TaxID=94469 RepID=UPI002892D849|nr:UDP-glycosyltransferase UGT5-like [Phlebotomus argentipes]
MNIFACFVILALPFFANSANILVLEAVPSPSHHIWIRTITTALAAAGHNVTSLSTDIEEETPENLHYLHLDKVYDVMYNPEDEDFEMEFNYFDMGNLNSYLQLFMFVDFTEIILKGSLKSTGFRQLLDYPDDFKFDLVIHDFMVSGILLPFAKKFNNPPIIALTAFFSVEYSASVVGGTLNTAYVPYIINNDGDLNTLLGRTNNFLLAYLDYFMREYYIAPKLNKILTNEFSWDVDIRELNKLSKIVMLNKHPGLDIIEEAFPNIISVGGLQIQRNDKLPIDLQEILDSAKNGAILFSLGTNVKSKMLGDARQIEILEAFRALPQYTFIWKFEAESMPVKVPSNVIIKKWIPQNDLLAHPNVKLFISHCGLLSTQESVWYGVPILGLPVFADQFQNLQLSIKTGVAEQGDLRNMERNAFKKLIEKMINDPKYNENAKIRSKIFRDQKETPLERAIWWIEYVLRHPNMTHMRSPSMDYNIAQRQSWDVLAFLYTVILVTVLILVKIFFLIIRRCLTKKPIKPKRE